MKTPLHLAASLLLLALASSQSAHANLITDGTFTSVTDLSGNASAGYGQIGPDGNGSAASGATLELTGWSTGGYNYVFTPGTIDGGTTAGPNTGVAAETGGTTGTYMWGTHNGGSTAITNPPGGGNIVAADGAYETGAITQSVSGLTVGKTYALTFYYAGAQQQGYTSNTTEKWVVNMGTGAVAGNFSTTTLSVPGKGFSGWYQATMYFYAGATTETLSFLAAGTPNGQPPFSLLADVDLQIVPDFSNWMVFAGFGAICLFSEVMRRRRRPLTVPLAA